MRCENCGNLNSDNQSSCSRCGQPLTSVQILSPEERENFTGVTIEEESHQSEEDFYYQEYAGPNGSNQRIFVRRMTINNSPGKFLRNFLVGIVLVGLVIVAFPVALVVLGFFLLNWFINRLNR